jgi:hypothetical protein
VLPRQTTLRSVAHLITEEYLRRVLENVSACQRGLGDAIVFVSIEQTFKPPDYSVMAIMDAETNGIAHWGSFSGATYRPLSDRRAWNAIWADEHMTWDEVRTLLGEARGFPVPGRTPR